MKSSFLNILNLSIKELKTLLYDKAMLVIIIYSFTFAIYIGGTKTSTEIYNATIAFVDNDRSALSGRIINSFYKPRFKTPDIISFEQIDTTMDSGYYTFVVVIPPSFEKDIRSGNSPEIQVNIDATRMSQAGIGGGYISHIITDEINTYLKKSPSALNPQIIPRYKYNPNLTSTWFGTINEIINNIVMLSILLSGAALIREREHGTIGHLMVMPIKPYEIMLSKILSISLLVMICVSFSITLIVQMLLQIPISGSLSLFMFSTFLVLFATTSIGIFIGTIAQNMPQMGMIFILTILPMMMLSGSITPFESMPKILQYIMQFMPTSHFVELAQAILFKGANIDLLWDKMLIIFCIGIVFFIFTLLVFKKSLESEM